ncbi:MAG: HAD family phosphatase [Kiritimatiellae bacterium]|nr:HAD family phosphatase [Kiritimatiellia bacterium]
METAKRDIRIIALDLDGTLLDSDKRLSEVNRAALEAAARKGIAIVPTTGRFFGGMPEAVRDLPFVRYAITINGAQVYDRQTDTAMIREEMPLATALAIMRYLDGFDVIYDCYQDNWGRMTAAMQEKAADYTPDDHYLKMVRELRKPYPDLKAYLAERGADVQKVMLFAKSLEVRAEIAAGLKARFPEIAISSSTVNNLELNAGTAHQGRALQRFAEALGLTLGHCMALGDGINDLTMIQAAGLGVAMANAHPDVLAAADAVTASNDEDGVARAIERFCL